jgi:predicted transcriptional regulator
MNELQEVRISNKLRKYTNEKIAAYYKGTDKMPKVLLASITYKRNVLNYNIVQEYLNFLMEDGKEFISKHYIANCFFWLLFEEIRH